MYIFGFSYRNVSGLFRESEEEVRPEIDLYLEDLMNHWKYAHNEYGIDINDPFKGLFAMTGQRRRYVLNRTRQYAIRWKKQRFFILITQNVILRTQ